MLFMDETMWRNQAICFNSIWGWNRVTCHAKRSSLFSPINHLDFYTKKEKSKNTKRAVFVSHTQAGVHLQTLQICASQQAGGPWRPAHLASPEWPVLVKSFRNLISILISKNRFVLSNCYAMVITHCLLRIQPLFLAKHKVCKRLLLLEIQIRPSDSNLTTFLLCVYKKHNL